MARSGGCGRAPSGDGSRGSRSPRPLRAGARSASWRALSSRPSSESSARSAARARSASVSCPAHHDQIVGVADEHAAPACLPVPVEPVQVDVAEQGRDHPALRRAADAAPDRPVLHHPARNSARRSLRRWRSTIRSSIACINRVVRDRLETVGDIRLDHPPPAPPASSTMSCRASCADRLRPKAERARLEVGLEDRLDHRLRWPPARSGRAPSGSTAAAAPGMPGFGMKTRRAGSGR